MAKLLAVACVTALLCQSPILHAAQVVAWNLGNNPDFSPGIPGNIIAAPSTASAPNIVGIPITRGPGLTAPAAFTESDFTSVGWESAADSTTSNEYLQWGFNVASGFQVKLDKLLIGFNPSNASPGLMGLYTSLDNFASPVAQFDFTGFVSDFAPDLSALPAISGEFRARLYQIGNLNLNGTTTVATNLFRIEEYDPDYDVEDDFMDVQFTGAVQAVPEPAAAFLAAIGAAGVAIVRRPRR
jgi:hypothetical protein